MVKLRHFTIFLSAFLYATLAGLSSSAMAADTEIYLDTPSSIGVANLLFILDTSTSMNNKVDEDNSGAIDPGERSRIEVLKQAMTTLLDTMPNLNVGLMRYNWYGGSILFPVTRLDAFACDIEGNCPTVAGAMGMDHETVTIANNDNDVEEYNSVALVQTNARLTAGVNQAGSSCTIMDYSFPIRAENDMMEASPWNPFSHSGGATRRSNSSDMEIPRDGSQYQLNGLWFRNVDIPAETANTSILSAHITFAIDAQKSGHDRAVDIDVYAVEPDDIDVSSENLDNTDYTPADLYNDADHRFATKVDWDILASDDPGAGEPFVSADITPLIQAVLGHSDWPTTTKNMAFLLEQDADSQHSKTGVRSVVRDAPSDWPTLDITYQTCASTNPANVRAGLRFPNINIPQGVTINSARIDFTAAEADGGAPNLQIKLEDTADAGAFSTPFSNARTYSATTVPWTSALTVDPLTDWTVNSVYSTPDLTAMLQEVVNKADWCGGNNMVFLLERTGGDFDKRTAYSYDGNATKAPVLYVSYDNDIRSDSAANGNPNYCSSSTISRKIAVASDDAEENANGAMNLGSSDLELVQDVSEQEVGLRFQDIPIARGAKIVSARLIFTADETSSGSMTLNFHGQDSDNAATFTSGGEGTNDISDTGRRPRTSATVAWSPPDFVNINNTHEIAGVGSIVQEIVSRSGWAAGNSLAILISGSGSTKRVVKSFDVDNGANAPTLEITFQGTPTLAKQTVRERLKEIVDDNLSLRQGTPILSSMVEAARYLRGETVIYGRQRGAQDRDKDAVSRVSVFASYDANGATVTLPDGCDGEDFTDSDCVEQFISGGTPTYKSPIVAECQTNYIINLTDGKGLCHGVSPLGRTCVGSDLTNAAGDNLNEVRYTEAFVAENASETPVTLGSCAVDTTLSDGSVYSDSESVHNECVVRLTKFLNDNDQIYTTSQNLQSGVAPIEGLQNIRTYTIGFNLCGAGRVTSEDVDGSQVCCLVANHDAATGICSAPETDPSTISVLKAMADVGAGEYFNASTVDELLASFTAITSNIIQRSTSFVAPSIAANAFNRLESRDEVYFGLFEPDKTTRWQGNVKKYRLCDETNPDGLPDSGDECTLGDVLDATGLVAIVDDPNQGDDGLFKTTATSNWTNADESPDGREIMLGGAGGEIADFTTRTIYTEENDNGVASSGVPLATDYEINSNTWSADQFDEIRGDVCPVASSTAASPCEDRMLYILGKDVTNEDNDDTTDTRWWFHDVLHSSPKVVTYGADDQGDADPDNDEFVDKVYVATNDGALHAINGLTGVEEWAFMPNTVFPDQRGLFDNSGAEHIYGLDSTPVLRVEDVDGDGIIEPEDGDLVHIYVAQRRGGRNMYALDITPSSTLTSNSTAIVPKFLWRIEGGSGDFARMGDSWSEPQLTTIQTGVTSGDNPEQILKEVLIFGGGYDNDLDDIDKKNIYKFGTEGGDPNEGNAIYIVDAETGALIFWISSDTATAMSDSATTGRRGADIVAADMKFAIPSNISVNDTDGDGLGDRLYVGDTAGQVWRVDIADDIDPGGNNPQGSSVVGRLASISTAGIEADERRFYSPPAVVYVVDTVFSDARDGEFDYVLMPSGYRAHPLDTNIRDRFYAFRDSTTNPMIDCTPLGSCAKNGFAEDYPAKVDQSEGLGAPITNTDLVNISSAVLTAADASRLGWYFDFNQAAGTTNSGEKGLSPGAVFDGTLIFTTFIPSGPDDIADACSASDGSGAAYNFNILSGGAGLDWDGDGDIDINDRKQKLGSGIPSEAVPIFTKEGVTVLVGTGGGAENLGQVSDLPRYRTYWYEES